MPILSYVNEISFTCKFNSFLYEWLWTKPRFDREAYGNSAVDLLMVIMASGIPRGRVRTMTMTTTKSRNMAAIHQLIG